MKCDICGRELDKTGGFLVIRWFSSEGGMPQEKTLSSFCVQCFTWLLSKGRAVRKEQ